VPGEGGGGNGTFITPLANRRSSQTVVEMNYHFALRDVVGGSGSFYDLHYSDMISSSESLVDTRTASGTVFWLHQLFRGDWAGVSYRFQRVTFDPDGETRVHTFMVNNTLNMGRGFTISGFIGPEYSDNIDTVTAEPNSGEWALAGGVEGGWRSPRTSVTGGYSRQASDGGGVLGVVRLQNVHGAVRQELFPGWAVTLGANHGDNSSLNDVSPDSPHSIRITSVGVTLDHNIGRSLGIQVEYFHDFQSQSGIVTSPDTDRNRFFVTLTYQWLKALGR